MKWLGIVLVFCILAFAIAIHQTYAWPTEGTPSFGPNYAVCD